MLRLFEVLDKNSEGILIGAKDFSSKNLPCYVVYDTPTEGQEIDTSTGGIQLPDYVTWKAYTVGITTNDIAENINSYYRTSTSTGISYLNPFGLAMNGTVRTPMTTEINVLPFWNNHLFTNQQFRTLKGYDQLVDTNFSVITSTEYTILRQLITRLDFVRRRYPSRFEKKYVISELLLFMEAALIEINLTSPVTMFWWFFTEEAEGQYQRNGLSAAQGYGVPELLWPLVVDGAVIHALIAKGILEVDLHFTYSDQGISLGYENAAHYSSWYDKMLQQYVAKKTQYKQHWRPKGKGIGTVPEFGLGWFGMLNSLYDNRLNGSVYPFWLSGNSGKAQL